MDTTYSDEDKLLMYLRGELDDDEQAAIAKRLQEDADLQKMKADLLLAQAAIWQEGRKQEAEKLKQRYRNRQQPARTRPMFIRYAAVAAIVILAGLAAVLLLQKPSDPQALFAEAYTMPLASEQLAVTTTDSTQVDSLRREAFASYNDRNFEQAQTQLKELMQVTEGEKLDKLRLYFGISQLEQGNSSAAIESFTQMNTNTEAAQWYTAMAYLKIANMDKLEAQLKRIMADPEHFYYEKAEKLLEKL